MNDAETNAMVDILMGGDDDSKPEVSLRTKGFSLEDMPEAKALLDNMTREESTLVLSMLRAANVVSGLDGLVVKYPEMKPVLTALFSSVESIMQTLVQHMCKEHNIGKDRFEQLCSIADRMEAMIEDLVRKSAAH